MSVAVGIGRGGIGPGRSTDRPARRAGRGRESANVAAAASGSRNRVRGCACDAARQCRWLVCGRVWTCAATRWGRCASGYGGRANAMTSHTSGLPLAGAASRPAVHWHPQFACSWRRPAAHEPDQPARVRSANSRRGLFSLQGGLVCKQRPRSRLKTNKVLDA